MVTRIIAQTEAKQVIIESTPLEVIEMLSRSAREKWENDKKNMPRFDSRNIVYTQELESVIRFWGGGLAKISIDQQLKIVYASLTNQGRLCVGLPKKINFWEKLKSTFKKTFENEERKENGTKKSGRT